MKVVTGAQMREIDRRTIEEIGIPSLVLMERAGETVADGIEKHFKKTSVTILSGGGNNGGDGLVTARVLKNRGWDAQVLLLADEDGLSPDCLSQYRILKGMDMDVSFRKRLTEDDMADSIIVDAILGTGLNKPVKGRLLKIIDSVNRSRSPVISVDIPSGISSDTGQIMGLAVRADYTVTFGPPKIGHFIHPGAEYTGKLLIEDIGFPDFLTYSDELTHNLADSDFVRKVIKKRRTDSHKGTYGHVFVIAGSEGKTGAAMLASRACMRTGAGAVTLGVPERLFDIFQARVLEEMTLSLPSNNDGTLSRNASRKALDFIRNNADTVLIGPGIGVNEDISDFVCDIITNSAKPLLIDADALNCIRGKTDILKKARTEVVVTPHPNEMKRLLSGKGTVISVSEININRIETAKNFSAEYGVTTVLKGVPTVTASPGGEIYINSTGNPGMATAGSGDVLSGVIASLTSQGYDINLSAVCGVYIHGLSGDAARDDIGEYSLVAGDIIENLPRAFGKIVNALRFFVE